MQPRDVGLHLKSFANAPGLKRNIPTGEPRYLSLPPTRQDLTQAISSNIDAYQEEMISLRQLPRAHNFGSKTPELEDREQYPTC